MTHSQQPSIDILRKKIDFTAIKGGVKFYTPDEILIMEETIEEIKALPQELTTDEMLEEMPEQVTLWKCEDGYATMYFTGDDTRRKSGYGKTPTLALLALKEKLSTNN